MIGTAVGYDKCFDLGPGLVAVGFARTRGIGPGVGSILAGFAESMTGGRGWLMG